MRVGFPCYEGFSRTHADVLLRYGYRPRPETEQADAQVAVLRGAAEMLPIVGE